MRRLFNVLIAWQHRRQRQIDIQILWPMLKSRANSMGHARDAFLLHVMQDPAWSDVSDNKLISIINKLT